MAVLTGYDDITEQQLDLAHLAFNKKFPAKDSRTIQRWLQLMPICWERKEALCDFFSRFDCDSFLSAYRVKKVFDQSYREIIYTEIAAVFKGIQDYGLA